MNTEKIRVLLVEDNPTDALIVREELAHTSYAEFSLVHIDHLSEALARLKTQRFDVVLLDLNLPDSDGFDTFVKLHDAASEIPIVVISGRVDGLIAVQAVQAGAQDYLEKGRLGEDVLQRSIRYAIERQRSERTLTESEERYRLLIERASDGYLVHCDGRIVFANTASLKLFGAEHLEQLLGQPILERISPAFHSILRQETRHPEASGSSPTIEVLGIRLDGTTVAMEKTSNSFLHEGRPAVQVVLRDITARMRSEERFRWLVDSNAQGVMFWNTRGETTGANDACLSMLGYNREDLETGKMNWVSMTPPEFMEIDRQCMETMRAHKVCAPYEKQYIRKDGSEVSILVGAATFEDNPEEGVSFMVDLTERKKLELHSLRAQRMESIGTLAGGIAHDLNNTLGPILMSIDLLKLKFPNPESQELLAIIHSCAQRGADMVRQVLSFARGVEGRRMEVQVKHLLGEIEKIAYETFPKNIQIRTIVPHDLWTVIGDPTQLHQVLLNLCVNARDAMPNGGALTLIAENLTLDAQYAGLSGTLDAKSGPYVSIQVMDTGTGITAITIEKIFDPFFTTKELGKGTGLGLSTSMAILKSHGGFIRVYSELGKGTKFSVYLPAQTDASPESLAQRTAEMPRGNGELILIVDDEAAVREITQQTLEAFGYRVIVASNGADAVAVYARRAAEIAVVLTDAMMPFMDGVATIQVLRRMNPAVRLIGASGLGVTGSGAQAASLGVKHFLPKPFTAETLLKTLRQVLTEEPRAESTSK